MKQGYLLQILVVGSQKKTTEDTHKIIIVLHERNEVTSQISAAIWAIILHKRVILWRFSKSKKFFEGKVPSLGY